MILIFSILLGCQSYIPASVKSVKETQAAVSENHTGLLDIKNTVEEAQGAIKVNYVGLQEAKADIDLVKQAVDVVVTDLSIRKPEAAPLINQLRLALGQETMPSIDANKKPNTLLSVNGMASINYNNAPKFSDPAIPGAEAAGATAENILEGSVIGSLGLLAFREFMHHKKHKQNAVVIVKTKQKLKAAVNGGTGPAPA